METKYAFVINPNAGVKKKLSIELFISANFPKIIPYDIIIWDDANDTSNISNKIKLSNYDYVIACGGDGTVNMVASMLVNTQIALGILPLGSGNGLARSNNIPMALKKALVVIAKGNTVLIDSGKINDKLFFCTAGIGFDALIAHRFAESTKRGFFTYFKTSLKEFFNYKPHFYSITVDGLKTETQAFLITVANAGQWGNDIYIAPAAKLNDGFFHISVLKPFPLLTVFSFAIKLLLKKADSFFYLKTFIGKTIRIEFEGTLPVHFDGEPLIVYQKMTIEMVPLSLKIIC